MSYLTFLFVLGVLIPFGFSVIPDYKRMISLMMLAAVMLDIPLVS